jgi:hypothetical protein
VKRKILSFHGSRRYPSIHPTLPTPTRKKSGIVNRAHRAGSSRNGDKEEYKKRKKEEENEANVVVVQIKRENRK